MAERILVFGGSFDPPHKGHEALLDAAIKKIRPTLVLVVVAYRSPWKKQSGAGSRERVQMARLAFPMARVMDLEIRLRRRVYTVETLELVARKYPRAEIHFVMGSDLAERFCDWKNPRRLRELASWWTARRSPYFGGIPYFFKDIQKKALEISSTESRVRLLSGESVSHWISPEILKFISARGLYGTRIIPRLKKILTRRRFFHTLSVAALARDLAPVWKTSSWDAVLAALLHDAGRSIPVSKMESHAIKRHLKIPLFKDICVRQPVLLHPYISEDLARRYFGVKDPEILKAIRYHTLAAKKMSPLSRLIYVADTCSKDRAYPGAAGLRKLASLDPDAAFKECLSGKIRYALSQGGWIHPGPMEVWNFLNDS